MYTASHNCRLHVRQRLLPWHRAVPVLISENFFFFLKKLDDSHLSALVSFPGSRDCENGKLFISSIKWEHLAFWREEEGKRIKTPTGAKGPPEAKGGSWGDLNGNNKTTEEACFGVLFLIFRILSQQGKLWPWVKKQNKRKFIFKYFKVSWTLPPAQSNLTRS